MLKFAVAPVFIFSTLILLAIIIGKGPDQGLSNLEASIILANNVIALLIPKEVFNIHLITLTGGSIYVNLVGAGIPIATAAYIISKRRKHILKTLTTIAATAIAAYMLSTYQPGQGAVITLFGLVPLTACIATAAVYLKSSQRTSATSYAAGIIGVLIGTDIPRFIPKLMNTSKINEGIIGGAGINDAIMIAGLTVVMLNVLVIWYTPDPGNEGQARPKPSLKGNV